MSVTELPITMLVRAVQPRKVQLPISVTESGMTMLVRPVQSSYIQLIVYQLSMIKMVEK